MRSSILAVSCLALSLLTSCSDDTGGPAPRDSGPSLATHDAATMAADSSQLEGGAHGADAGASVADASGYVADGGRGSDASAPASLHWYLSCGGPLCQGTGVSDDPAIANCQSERIGDACSVDGGICDGVAQCGAHLVCSATDPTMRMGGCPISRARYKQDVSYLDDQALRRVHDRVLHMPLASYSYKHAPAAGPQLGFIIEDIEPSLAVQGDQVNLYGYLSMAVAAIQVQQREIDALRLELAAVRADTGSPRARRSARPSAAPHVRAPSVGAGRDAHGHAP